MRSNSGRRRMRSDAASPCGSTGYLPERLDGVPSRRPCLPLVSDGQAFAGSGAAPFQHNTAVLGCHAYPEAVGLRAASGVGLVGASSFSHVRTMNANRFASVVLQSRTRLRPTSSSMMAPFGLSPKISTTVENTVENEAKASRRSVL